jgi:type VI secretion system protein ImpF
MVDLTPSERLQPCLLDRLTDDEPTAKLERRESRVMNPTRYRQAVLRDLAWLMNAHAHIEADGFDAFSEVPSSVLNYGVRDVTGSSIRDTSAEDIERQLRESIARFEPRINPQSVSIRTVVEPDEMSHRAIRFEIRGVLWAKPIPESLFIKTELDLETGECKLKHTANG